jgi:hypothetical protein
MSFRTRSLSGVSSYKSFKLDMKEAQLQAAGTTLSYFSLAKVFKAGILVKGVSNDR